MEFDHLPNAPIQEAVLDVRVRARSDLSPEELSAVHDRIKDDYPKLQTRRQVEVKVNPSRQIAEDPVFSLNGFRFESADGRDVIQFRTSGFSVNRLSPYKGWGHFFEKFERYWPLYLEVARPLSATRISARCINIIPAGEEGTTDDFFTATLEIPDGIPGTLQGFETNATLIDRSVDPPMSVTLKNKLQLAPDGRAAQFLFDIDAFTFGEFNLPEVASLFDQVHRLRNLTFFKSLTPQVIDRFR